MPTGGIDIGIGAGLADVFGATAGGLLADAGVGALAGGALGGLESGFSGGNVFKGIEKGGISGGLTGGGIGLGGDFLGSTIGTTAADAIGGAAGGAAGSAATGGNPLLGAVEGGASGGITGLLSPSSGSPVQGTSANTVSVPSAGAGVGAGGPSAGGTAAPAGVSSSFDTSSLDNVVNGLQNTGSAATTGANVGSGTVGTQGLPNVSGSTGNVATGSFDLGGNFGASGTSPSLASASNAAASAPSSVSQFLSHPSLSGAGNIITSNPGAAISAAGLGISALEGEKSAEGERQLKQEASNLAGQGQQLSGYLQSGTLPPGLQAGINQATDAAKATIRSQYASKGMSGSSAEQQDLAAVDQRAQAEGAQMAMQLLQTGISETGMASQLYQALMGESLKSDSSLGSAISNFASAAAGGGQSGKGGITVNYSGNP